MIISTSVLAGTLVVVALLIVISLGSIKLYKKILSNIKQKKLRLITATIVTNITITVVSQKRAHYGLSAHPQVLPRFSAKV